ncbi:venom serine protease inhibitor-like [Galleria mellonella]|uniref:Venom serine protease inhibitor-like n=1 Tax=Galleria mellonella TaxID=7137 RepID=A0A6J1WNJ0_GALME|nr:venom serine protease inhibitor-like [Galleria mellonella]
MFKSIFLLGLMANVLLMVSSADTCSGQNEVYNTCPVTCPPQTCAAIGQTYSCLSIPVNKTSDPGYCQPACVCEDGYLRNDNNVCIPKEDC